MENAQYIKEKILFPLEASPSPAYKILVIDDEPATLQILKLLLTKAAYHVTICETAIEGLKKISQNAYDCIITDVIMPNLSGYDFVRAIRRQPQFAGLPILVLTRKRNREDVKKALEAGVTDYAIKPIDEQLFLDKIELCIKKGQGKRHIFTLKLEGSLSEATVKIKCKILSLSESDLTLWSQVPLNENLEFHIKTQLFHEMNIDFPYLKLIECEFVPANDSRDAGYNIKLGFIGLSEIELKKIRNWMQRETILHKP
ncbi:MAG: response regulator [Bdellovibrio sp.]|nr:response regulator [Bdellovibrio sp.]